MLLLTSLGQRGDLYGVQHHLYGALRVPQALSLVAPISSPTSFAPCVDECHFVAMQPDSGVDSMVRRLDFHKYIGVREQGFGEGDWCVMSNRSVWTHTPTPPPFPLLPHFKNLLYRKTIYYVSASLLYALDIIPPPLHIYIQ